MTLNIKVQVNSEEGDMGTLIWNVHQTDDK